MRAALFLFDGESAWLVLRDRILELKGLAASCSVLYRNAAGDESLLPPPFVETASGRGRARTRSAPLFRSLERWLETGDLIRLDAVRESAFVVAGEWVETIIVGHASLLLVCGILAGAQPTGLVGVRPRSRTSSLRARSGGTSLLWTEAPRRQTASRARGSASPTPASKEDDSSTSPSRAGTSGSPH